jgi:hypothetical protein
MNIIFGREQADSMKEKYTILELDTFKIGDQIVTAFCPVGSIPITDMPKVESMKSLHANLIENYRKGDWNYCEQALEHLVGCWNSDLDSFYESIRDRIVKNKDTQLSDQWWIIEKDLC